MNYARRHSSASGYQAPVNVFESMVLSMLLELRKELDRVREAAGDEDLEKLCEEITAEAGIDVNLEGRYGWIVFLPNKSNGAGALNRYYGVLRNGELKVRGVEMRMSNTPGATGALHRY